MKEVLKYLLLCLRQCSIIRDRGETGELPRAQDLLPHRHAFGAAAVDGLVDGH